MDLMNPKEQERKDFYLRRAQHACECARLTNDPQVRSSMEIAEVSWRHLAHLMDATAELPAVAA